MKKVLLSIFALLIVMSPAIVAYAAAPVQNRFDSSYNPTKYNNDFMQYRMNCYGYASQFYYMGSASSTSPYKQQPGEFYNNTEQFASLMQSYGYAATYWNNLYAFVKDRVFEDYSTLGWSISEVTNANQAPAGYRKIALVIQQNGVFSDYHFYMQHSDGTWSHKPGQSTVRNTSFDTNEVLTNANITTKGQQGGYDDGIRFFVIGKDAVTDYPHNYGQSDTTTSTTTDFRDKAGDSITQSTYVTGSKSSRFDYAGDKDYFIFTPTSTRYHTITTSAGTGYDVDGVLYDANGNLVAADSSTSNTNFYAYLYAGQTYYIGMWDYTNHINYYTLLIS
ncbi:hypothetical protein [Cohnella sp. GCM10012308]|uniref:hypothetical protein n=1 Tax=Cohnella sp. GCM10012308 TaxID=3317329 RepID=UPI003621F74B